MSYGIQGWRTTQCVMQGVDSLFTMRLGYYNPHYGTRQSYTGNITESDWHHRAQPYQSYTFEYDGLNRLRTTRQYTGGAISDSDIEYPQYYDLNGNPQTLYRNSQGVRVTNFTYTYTGNQLTTLSDGSATYSYTYDTRGNMTRDGYHNLNLAYNHLNLLEKVSQNGSTVANYTYLSDGTKLSSANSAGIGFVYRGSLVYGKSGSMLSLESSGFGGGRLISASGSSTPHYYVTDHLGSVRVVLNNSGDIVSQHDYYPFGKSHDNLNLQTSPNRYLFNGKESQTFANVPYLDYGARMYDADIIRWKNLDPLLWKYLGISPFAFCGNNPIRIVDFDGRDWRDVVNGVAVALIDNMSRVNLRGESGYKDANHYNIGQDIGDIISVFSGVGTIGGGATMTGGGVSLAFATGGTSSVVSAGAVVTGVGMMTLGAQMTVSAFSNLTDQKGRVPNPDGSKGKPDHRAKVKELKDKADNELRPKEYVEVEQKIKVENSNRRPDVQIIDKNGKTRKVLEAERHPESKRNRLREQEYRDLGIEQETHNLQ